MYDFPVVREEFAWLCAWPLCIVVLMLGLVGVVTASSCVQILGFWAVVNKGEQRKEVEEDVLV